MSERFTWSDRYLLGYGPMDDTHKEFVSCVDELLNVPDAELAAALERFTDHARRHFDEELELMQGTAFPATDCHADEHAKVMESVAEVKELLARGNTAIVRALAAELVRWFPGHADYMDAALAQWVVRKKAGGVPVVLRRKDNMDFEGVAAR